MSRITIHSRKSWGARAPRPGRTPQNPSSVNEFFVHWPGEPGVFSGVTAEREREIVREFQNYHMDTHGWDDIGYSFLVAQSGRIYRGRGMTVVPSGQLNHNTGTIAVCCLIGQTDTPTTALRNSLRDLKHWAEGRAGHSLHARGHGEVTQTTCPGPHLRALVPSLNRF